MLPDIEELCLSYQNPYKRDMMWTIQLDRFDDDINLNYCCIEVSEIEYAMKMLKMIRDMNLKKYNDYGPITVVKKVYKNEIEYEFREHGLPFQVLFMQLTPIFSGIIDEKLLNEK